VNAVAGGCAILLKLGIESVCHRRSNKDQQNNALKSFYRRFVPHFNQGEQQSGE
jgi:hypothetical protein